MGWWNDFIQWLDSKFDWLQDLLLWVPRKLFDQMMTGFEWMYLQIPTPDWIFDVALQAAGIAPEMIYWMTIFEVNAGIGIMLSAQMIRFLIRRVPLVG